MTAVEQPLARSASRAEHITLGIVFMLFATILFACSNAISKWQVVRYSFGEVLFWRSAGAFIVCALLILPRMGLGVFRTHRLRHHVARNMTQATAQACIVIALGLMPLAGAVAINFSAPLVATVAAALLLGEKVGPVRWAALLVGFFGVLVVAAPGADSFRVGALFALGNAVLYGSVTAAVRGMTATETTETLTMHQMTMLLGIFTLLLPFGFARPDANDVWMMLASGALYGCGQYIWTRALSLAPTSAVGPFYYFTLVWAIIIGFLVWGDMPSPALLAGSAVVVGSGLFLLWHESGRKELAAE